MRPLFVLLAIYVAVISAVGIGGALFARRLKPSQLNLWLPRLRLINLVLVCTFIIGVAAYVRVWFLALPALAIVLFYPYVRHVRVCESCGTVAEPVGWDPSAYCSRCGSSLRSPSSIDAPRPPNPRLERP
jgi:hypothetical protein